MEIYAISDLTFKEKKMENKLMSKTFMWMSIGLLLTFATGFLVANNQVMYENIYTGSWYVIFIIIELALVLFLSVRVMNLQPTTAKCCFLLYSIVSGLTFSSIFIYYQIASLIYIFLITFSFFAILSFIGYFTQKDLTKLGTYCIAGLFVTVVISIINILLRSSMLNIIMAVVGIVLFTGITMYDIQKLKSLANSNLPVENLAIYGALDLYLDFINIFIELLSIFGKRND